MKSGSAAGLRVWLPWLRPQVPALLLALALLLVQSMATLAQPWLGGVLAERLVHAQATGRLLWGLFALVAAQAGLGYATTVQLQKVTGRLVAEAGSRVYAHLQALPLGWHHERQRGDVLALLTGDIHRLGGYLSGTLVPLLPLLFTFVGALLLMLKLAPLLALAVAALVPLLALLLKLSGRRLRPLGQATMQAWADQSALAAQNLELLPVVKAFATDALEAKRYREGAQRLHLAELRQVRWQGALQPLVQVLGAGLVLLLLGVAGRSIVGGQLQVGALVSLFLYGLVLVGPVGQLANVYGQTQGARGAARRVLDALAAPVEQDAGTLDALPRDGDLLFDGVDFAYPGRPPLFKDLQLHIRAGETVAITGANGAGKSTLAHLLLRLLEPQQGSIRVGGVDLRKFRLAALRGQVGLVAQQVMLFNASVLDNIAYGRADAGMAEVERAARAARAHDFIQALPQGYATRIGDQGVKLSGGQKQRIALARALLKDPAILVLDEATAMFDPAGESEFIAECHEALRARTVLLITHRPASLALADRVLRLQDGILEAVAAAPCGEGGSESIECRN